MTNNKPKISLTGVLLEDREAKGFTAWFEEFPEAVAEGETEEEVKQNLFLALINVLEVRREEEPKDMIETGSRYRKTSFDLELA